MPIDPSIPLGYQPPQLMSPAQMIQLRNLQRQGQLEELNLAEAQRQNQVRAQMMGITSNPQNFDPQTGTLTLGAIQKLGGVDPGAFMKAGEDRRVALSQLSVQRVRDAEVQAQRAEAVKDVSRTTVNAYDQAFERTGGNQQEALRAATEARNKAVDEYFTSGRASTLGFTDDDHKRFLSQPPSIDQMRAQYFTPQEIHRPQPAPRTRNRISGDVEIQEEFDPKTSTWKEIGRGPRFAKQIKDTGFGGENGELMAALAERGISLPTGFRSKEQQVALLNGLRERNPGKSADQIADMIKNGQIDLANLKKAGQVAAGIAGKTSYADEELQRIIPLVREASEKLPRGQFIPYNKLKQMGQESFSNPDLARFRQRMTMLSNAFDMLAARGGTDKEKRAEQRKSFETAPSQEALEAVLQSVDQEAKISGEASRASMERFKGGAAGKGSAPQAALDHLKAHPELKEAFKSKYGYLPDGL